VDAAIDPRPVALGRDPAYRANFKCAEMSARNMGRSIFTHLQTSNAMLPPRYTGNNRGSYMNPELDKILDAWFAAATVPERLSIEREAIRFVTTDLPIVQTIAEPTRTFQAKGVTGIVSKSGLDIRVSVSWNAHEWDKAGS
jgi:ABC-type transport system substrate-binding protein